MADIYGYPRHRTMFVPAYLRDEMEYPGFDRSWVLGREDDYSHYDAYGRPRLYDYYRPPYSRPMRYYDTYDSGYPRLAWPTEIPLKIRLSLYSDGNKLQLEEAIRDIYGVCDVAIYGLNNAVMTVTGTASSVQIMKVVRQFDGDAEIWSDSVYGGRRGYRHGAYY